MTTFTGDLNVKDLDSSVTAVNITRGGGATFTGPVTFVSSVAVSGAMNFTGALALVSGAGGGGAIIKTTAGNPVALYPSVACRGVLKFTVEGTTAWVPFYY